MKLCFLLILFNFAYSLGNIVTRVNVINFVDYMIDVATETLIKVEERKWCNLKVPDADPIEIDEVVLGWPAKGNVTYTNGFVVSIHSADLLQSSVRQQVNLNSDRIAQAIVRGTLRLNNVAIGYDVQANLETGTRYFTAKYVYHIVNMDFTVTKIIDSDNITVTVVGTVTNYKSVPVFMPKDRISDALSTLFSPTMSTDGIIAWGVEIFQPIAEEVIKKVTFPPLCYNCA